MTLEHELETFRTNLSDLLATSPGKFVLIHGDKVVGTWDTWGDALDAGYERFGLDPFLVKQIVANEKPIFVTREVR